MTIRVGQKCECYLWLKNGHKSIFYKGYKKSPEGLFLVFMIVVVFIGMKLFVMTET